MRLLGRGDAFFFCFSHQEEKETGIQIFFAESIVLLRTASSISAKT
jgi:hypothetical protein